MHQSKFGHQIFFFPPSFFDRLRSHHNLATRNKTHTKNLCASLSFIDYCTKHEICRDARYELLVRNTIQDFHSKFAAVNYDRLCFNYN